MLVGKNTQERLTGSLAASWQRWTKLSKVDLRIMCSAGISFCSTLSVGSCWRSWRNRENTEMTFVHLAQWFAVVTWHKRPMLYADLHAGLLGGSRWDLGMILGLRGLRWESHHRCCDRCWWSVVIRDLSTHQLKCQWEKGWTNQVLFQKMS